MQSSRSMTFCTSRSRSCWRYSPRRSWARTAPHTPTPRPRIRWRIMDSDAIIGTVVLAGFIVLIAAVIRTRRKRRRAIEAWATGHGWSYRRSEDLILRQRRSPTVNRGVSEHVLQGTGPVSDDVSLAHYAHAAL